MKESGNLVLDKSKAFAIRVIRLYQYLQKRNEFVLSKQLLRSDTSIGANVKEGVR
jgi:four helix bundle protein